MPFVHCALRTTDVAAAGRFYAEAVGVSLRLDGAWPQVIELPARARAAGAPAHWVAFVGVADVAAATAHLVTLGFSPLGPPGVDRAIFRDPSGAVVGIASGSPPPPPLARVDHASTDVARALADYRAAFDWPDGARSQRAELHAITVALRGPIVCLADTARRPGVHPQWAVAFAVDELEPTCARVTAAGGDQVGAALEVADGAYAYCHDAQGAAFAVIARAGA